MQRRRQLLWLVALGATCVLAASAGAGTDRSEQQAVSFQLRIGNVLPFTGDLAAYGANLDQAVKIAVAIQNESLKRVKQPGISVRLVASEDGQTQAAASVEAATKLVKVDKVSVVIGEMASGATIPVAQSVTIPNKIVQITPTSTAPQITAIKDNGYLWRILASDTLQGRVLAQAAVGAFGRGATVNVGARNDAFGVALRALRRAVHEARRQDRRPGLVESDAGDLRQRGRQARRREPQGLRHDRLPGDLREDGARARPDGKWSPRRR